MGQGQIRWEPRRRFLLQLAGPLHEDARERTRERRCVEPGACKNNVLKAVAVEVRGHHGSKSFRCDARRGFQRSEYAFPFVVQEHHRAAGILHHIRGSQHNQDVLVPLRIHQ